MGGTMLATGRGEILQEISAMPKTNIVLVKPKVDVSTAWVYKNYHKVQDSVIHPDNKAMRKSLIKKDLQGICKSLGNVLEYVTIPEYPEIAKIKQKLSDYGAMAAMMSGSGPTVFAIVEDSQKAKDIVSKIQLDFDADVFAVKTAEKNF